MIRARGVDIAKYDYPFAGGMYDFVIQRLSYGMMADERLAELASTVMKFPIKGAYHYYSSGSPWKMQCDHFLGLEGGKYDFLALDVEKLYNYPSSAFLNGIAPAMDYLLAQSKRPVLLYIDLDIWNDVQWLNQYGAPINKSLIKYDLWVAQYYFVRRDTNPILASGMNPNWKFWQWNDRPIDSDDFNGTVDDLHAWAHPVAYKTCPMCNGTGKVPA